MRKKYFNSVRLAALCYLCVSAVCAFSQTDTYYRKTAVRHIETAKKLLAEENFDASFSQAALGLSYDNTIADLYFIQALGLSARGVPPYMILPAVKASLGAQWYDYNRDAARLLLADLLLKTGKSSEALALLDEKPALYTRDALYSRARALYISGKIGEARAMIKRAAFQYPEDEGFALLFFDAEYPVPYSDTDADFAELSELFLSRIGLLEKANPDILLKASVFAPRLEDTKRLLKAWNVYGKTDVRYGLYALQAGLLSENAAFDYMLPFLSGTIDYNALKHFISLITERDVKDRLRRFYEKFGGTIAFDTNKDGIRDMSVRYRMGRPSLIEYDKNQDGQKEWEAECDYGVPVKLRLFPENILLWYDVWPAAGQVICGAENGKKTYTADSLAAKTCNQSCTYSLRDKSLFWTPFQIIREPVSEIQGEAFLHIPVINENTPDFPLQDLFALSHTVERQTTEYADSKVRFSLLNGRIQYAVYTDNGTPYAYGYFEDGILRFRNTDKDKNGTYEMTEFYGYDAEKAAEKADGQSGEEEKELSLRLFGCEDSARGLYIQSAVFKNGEDVRTEEYGRDGSFVLSEKSGESGGWNLNYTKRNETEELIEYDHPFSGRHVSVMLEKSIPVSVNGQPVTKDPAAPFFWIGEYPGNFYAEMMIQMLNRKGGSGVIVTVSDLLWVKEKDRFIRIFAVKNGNTCFGEVLYE
ncbi:hypothetical protein V1L52_03930 [Treponema sp. HNW]|uniref:hypothetical protein n=1 Tax=Treponema sp. HNW TaxID=3116654 RepID=UPI003D0DD48F